MVLYSPLAEEDTPAKLGRLLEGIAEDELTVAVSA